MKSAAQRAGCVVVRGRHNPALREMLFLRPERWYILPDWVAGHYWRLAGRTWAALVKECEDHPGYPTKRDAVRALERSPLRWRTKYLTIWRVHEIPARLTTRLQGVDHGADAADS